MRGRAERLPTQWACALASFALLACQREPSAELIEVNRVAASEVQFGDSLQVVGDGFALGKPVLVHFRGRVYRAGVAAREVDIALGARAESQHELSVPLPREAEREFCGESSGAHVTFRGNLQVAIASNDAGAPPVTGTLRGSTLELYPALEPRANTERRAALGQRALEFFGIRVASARQGGLSVLSVAPGSRAATATLARGDRIVRAAGLSVLEPSDLVPEATRALELGVYRAGAPLSLLVEADGFHVLPPGALVPAALAIGVAALGLALWASPLLPLIAALLPPWLDAVRARYAAANRRRVSWSVAYAPFGGRLATLAWLGGGAALLAPALRNSPIDQGLGLLALTAGSALALLAASLIEGGRRGPRWSLRSGLGAAVQQLLVLLPAAVGLLAIGMEQGVDADEWVRAQGAPPWAWNAFANPGFSLLFLSMLLSALPRPAASRTRLRHARDSNGPEPASSLLSAVYAGSLCALVTLAFLGGGAGFTEQALAAGTGRLAASLIACLKCACLCAALAWLRELSQRLTLAQWAPLGPRLMLPGALAALLLARAWQALGACSDFWGWLLSGFGPVLVCALALGVPAGISSLLLQLRKPERFVGLSPWL